MSKLRCPSCGKVGLQNLNTREFKDGTKIYRRKECVYCGERFNTIESYVPDDVLEEDRWQYYCHARGEIDWGSEYER
jgi:transcriptional regulator NrdR family protein